MVAKKLKEAKELLALLNSQDYEIREAAKDFWARDVLTSSSPILSLSEAGPSNYRLYQGLYDFISNCSDETRWQRFFEIFDQAIDQNQSLAKVLNILLKVYDDAHPLYVAQALTRIKKIKKIEEDHWVLAEFYRVAEDHQELYPLADKLLQKTPKKEICDFLDLEEILSSKFHEQTYENACGSFQNAPIPQTT